MMNKRRLYKHMKRVAAEKVTDEETIEDTNEYYDDEIAEKNKLISLFEKSDNPKKDKIIRDLRSEIAALDKTRNDVIAMIK